MFIDKNEKRINPYAVITYEGNTYNGNVLLFPDVVAALGIREVPDPLPPVGYSENTYYRTEQDDAPYVVYTRKSQAVIDLQHNRDVWSKIAAIELANIMPRQLREMLLTQPSADQQPWYAKVKEVDDEIVELKATLRPEQP